MSWGNDLIELFPLGICLFYLSEAKANNPKTFECHLTLPGIGTYLSIDKPVSFLHVLYQLNLFY